MLNVVQIWIWTCLLHLTDVWTPASTVYFLVWITFDSHLDQVHHVHVRIWTRLDSCLGSLSTWYTHAYAVDIVSKVLIKSKSFLTVLQSPKLLLTNIWTKSIKSTSAFGPHLKSYVSVSQTTKTLMIYPFGLCFKTIKMCKNCVLISSLKIC